MFYLHSSLLFYMVMISTLVGYLYVYSQLANRIVYLNNAFILGGIALPSFRLLYLMDEIIEPQLTVKAIGNQWYWSYEYSDLLFDSYSSFDYDPWLLNVDNSEFFGTSYRYLYSSFSIFNGCNS